MLNKRTAANTLLALLLGVLLLFALIIGLSGRSHAAPAKPSSQVTKPATAEPIPSPHKQADIDDDAPWLVWNETLQVHQI